MTTIIARRVRGYAFVCALVSALGLLFPVQGWAQTETQLLTPFNQVEIEPAKLAKAQAATQEYQTKEAELKANTTLANADKAKQRSANYFEYLKKMEGLLNKEQREKARTLLVEAEPAVKSMRQKPTMPRFYEQLGLSDEQQAKAKDLNLQQLLKQRTLAHTGNYSPTDRAEENKYINEEFGKKLNDLLSNEQRAKLAELKKQAAVIAAIPVPPLYQKLGLNGTQTEKLRTVLYERQLKLDALHKDVAITHEARQTQMQELNAEADKQALTLLNKDQRLKLDDLVREANYRMPPFYEQLGLSEEQQGKLKETILWQAHEMAVLKANTTVTPEQRQQKLTAINQSVNDRLMAFLSPEQVTQLTKLIKEMQQKAQAPKP